MYPQDVIDEKFKTLPTFSYVNEEEEREPSYYDEEDGLPLHGMPIIPAYKNNFFASASFPPENISQLHSQPHTDGTVPGLASILTITNDTKYVPFPSLFFHAK